MLSALRGFREGPGGGAVLGRSKPLVWSWRCSGSSRRPPAGLGSGPEGAGWRACPPLGGVEAIGFVTLGATPVEGAARWVRRPPPGQAAAASSNSSSSAPREYLLSVVKEKIVV